MLNQRGGDVRMQEEGLHVCVCTYRPQCGLDDVNKEGQHIHHQLFVAGKRARYGTHL